MSGLRCLQSFPALNGLMCPRSRLMRNPAPERITTQTRKTWKPFRDSRGKPGAEHRHLLPAFECVRLGDKVNPPHTIVKA